MARRSGCCWRRADASNCAHLDMDGDRRGHILAALDICSWGLAIALCALLAPFAAQARDLVYLSSAIPAGLDVDGPSSSSVASQTGMVNLIEPLVYFKLIDEKDGVRKHYDFAQFQGRLAAESWSLRPRQVPTWTFHLRHDVKSCAGNGDVLTADDVVYSFGPRAYRSAAQGAISWLPLMSISNVVGFNLCGLRQYAGGLGRRARSPTPTIRIRSTTTRSRSHQSAPNQPFPARR